MGQAQRNDRYETVHRPAQRSRKNGTRSNVQEIDIIAAKKRSGGAKGAARSKRARDSRERTLQREVELWPIDREDGQPRMMRLADSRGAQDQRRREVRAVKRRKAKRRKVLLYRCITLFVIAVCLVLIYQTTGAIYRMLHDKKTDKSADGNKGIVEVVSQKLGGNKIEPPAITEDFLEINDYSRPGTKLNKVKSVFVHYTANPGTTAKQNRSYFANLAETHERSASAHFIIGYDGELVQCIPMEEQAYAVATRNEDSVSIECCYQDEEGKFTQETYDTLVHMLAWLMQEYNLSTDDILRHYDCGGKMCPLYYVEHEDAWDQLLADVENYEPESAQ